MRVSTRACPARGLARVRAAAVSGILACILGGGRARADEPMVTSDRLRAAEEEYDAGRRAFLADQFEAAALHFENAFRDAPRSQVLRNAIRSRQKAKQLARAATLAEVARRRYPADVQTRELADEVIAEAAQKLHEVRVTCSVECTVTSDGKIASLEDTKSFVLFLDPGPHSLTFAFPKGGVVARTVDAKPAGHEEIAIVAPPLPKIEEKPDAPAPASKPKEGGLRPSTGLPPAVFFVGVGLTLAAGAATAVSGFAAVSSPGKEAVREGCVGQGERCELYKSGLAGEVRTNVGIGITGGLTLMTGVVGIFLTDWGGPTTTRSARLGPHAASPTLSVGWQSVSVAGQF